MVSGTIERFPEVDERLYDVVEAHFPTLQEIGQPSFPTLILEEPVGGSLLLGFLRDGRLKVIAPITVKVTSENEDIIVEAEDFNEFGFGNNLSEALADLQRAIVELYFTLEKEQERLGTDMQHVWDALRAKIIKRI